MTDRFRIKAIAYREGDAWIAQGIEYDIVAFARDMADLPGAFSRAVSENICIASHIGKPLMTGVGKAPEKFQEMYDNASWEVRPTRLPSGGAEVAVRMMA